MTLGEVQPSCTGNVVHNEFSNLTGELNFCTTTDPEP
jgi:hypothetical protein